MKVTITITLPPGMGVTVDGLEDTGPWIADLLPYLNFRAANALVEFCKYSGLSGSETGVQFWNEKSIIPLQKLTDMIDWKRQMCRCRNVGPVTVDVIEKAIARLQKT